MKQLFIVLMIVLVFLTGCSQTTEFNPKIKQIINKIEVYSEYDPLSFVSNISSDDVIIEVVDNPIDITKPGNYNITYSISNKDNQSVELSYLVAVVDETKPTIQLITDITTNVNQEIDFSNFVTVSDNYDTNLSNNLTINGNYNLNEAGEYQVQLQVTDSSNNTAVKTVTIYVVKDETNDTNNSNSIVGTYKVDYMDEDNLNPSLILSNEETFTLVVNYCVGLRTFTGTYSVVGNKIILESDGLTFDDDDPSSTSITMTINNDGNLIYENSYGACSPIHKDIFIKQ